jgi:hypothetical protein
LALEVERRWSLAYQAYPSGAPQDPLPHGAWTPYVCNCWVWNLKHATSLFEPALRHENLVLNIELAVINNQNAAIAEFLGRSTLDGRFWIT